MAETENDQVNTRSRSRTRRSALTDISNFGNNIVGKLSSVTKRISTNTKKRKFQVQAFSLKAILSHSSLRQFFVG